MKQAPEHPGLVERHPPPPHQHLTPSSSGSLQHQTCPCLPVQAQRNGGEVARCPSHCFLQRPAHLLRFRKGRSEFVLSRPVFCKSRQVLVPAGPGDKQKVAASCKAISMCRAQEESEPALEQGKELLAPLGSGKGEGEAAAESVDVLLKSQLDVLGHPLVRSIQRQQGPSSSVYTFPSETAPTAPTEHPHSPLPQPHRGWGTGRIVRSPGASSICEVSGSKCSLHWAGFLQITVSVFQRNFLFFLFLLSDTP